MQIGRQRMWKVCPSHFYLKIGSTMCFKLFLFLRKPKTKNVYHDFLFIGCLNVNKYLLTKWNKTKVTKNLNCSSLLLQMRQLCAATKTKKRRYMCATHLQLLGCVVAHCDVDSCHVETQFGEILANIFFQCHLCERHSR